MKQTILAIITFLPFTLFAQDLITKIDGSEIESKIIEINSAEIKYKRSNYNDGPLFIIDKKDVSEIKYENGEVEKFQKTSAELKEDYAEKEKSDISSIFQKGNNAYLEKEDDANNDALNYFKKSLENWGYWSVVEDKSEADFIIVFSLKNKPMGEREVRAVLKTLNQTIYMKTKRYSGNPSVFSGMNGSRVAANKLVEKFFKKTFK